MLQGPTTGMVRPHPAVWRLVHGVMVLYLLSLIFMLFQDVGDARLLLKVPSIVLYSPSITKLTCWCMTR